MTSSALNAQKLSEIGKTEAQIAADATKFEKQKAVTSSALNAQKLSEIGKIERDGIAAQKAALIEFYSRIKFDAGKSYTGQGPAIAAAQATSQKFGREATSEFLGPNKQYLLEVNDQLAGLKKSLAAIPVVNFAATSSTKELKDSHVQLTAAMNESRSAARGLAGSVGAMWATYGSVVPLVAFATIGAALRSIYEEGKKVEFQLAFIKGLGGSSITQAQVESATAGSLATPAQALDGLRALTQSGLSTTQALSALPDVLSLATVGETNVGEAAYAATGVLKAFGLEIGEIGRVSDVMAKAAAVSNASVQDMMAAFKYASAGSSMYGVSLEETGAALAMLAEKNIKGSMAGTAHMNLLREIYTPVKKAGEAFKSLGLNMTEMQRQGLSSVEMIDRIREATSKLDSSSVRAFAAAIGGERGQRELAPLLEGGTKKLTEMQAELENAKGFTKSVMMELQSTVEGSTARMKQSITFAFSGAFESGKGSIQAFENTLATAFSNPDFKTYISSLAVSLVSVTRFLIDHSTAIKNMTLAYLGFKSASVVTTLLSEVAAATGRSIVATQAKIAVMGQSTAVSAAEGISTQGRTQAERMHTAALEQAIAMELVKKGAVAGGMVAVEAATVATLSSTVAITAAGRVASFAATAVTGLSLAGVGIARAFAFLAGPIGVVIGLVLTLGTLWEALTSKQGGARDIQDSYTNSISNTNRVLDQEIERLRLKKSLLDNPGKTEAQATVGLQIDRQSNYITQVQDAYEKDVVNGASTRLYGKGQSHTRPSYSITGIDGQNITVNSGADLKALYDSLSITTGSEKGRDLKLSPRAELLNLVKKNDQVNSASTQLDARGGQDELIRWIDQKTDELTKRRSNEGNNKSKNKDIDEALSLLKQYGSKESLNGVVGTKQAQAIEKQLQLAVDKSGDKWTMPNLKADPLKALDNAKMTSAIKEIHDEEAELTQYIKFRKDLDAAKYNPALFGAQATAMIAEQQGIAATTLLIDEQVKVIAKLTALKKPGSKTFLAHLDDPGKERLESEINQEKDKLRKARMAQSEQAAVAKAHAGSELQIEENKRIKDQAELAGLDNEEMAGLRRHYSKKVIDPASAEATKASDSVDKRYQPKLIAMQEALVAGRKAENVLLERRNEIQNSYEVDDSDLKEINAVIAGLQAKNAIEEASRTSLLTQMGKASSGAGKLASDLYNGSLTAEYGWSKFWENYENAGTSAAKTVEGIMKGSTDQMSSALATFVTTGKLHFKDLMGSMASMAAKLLADKAMASLLGMVANFAVGAFSTGASPYSLTTPGVSSSLNPATPGGGGLYSLGGSTPVKFANGGVMTEYGNLPLRKYAIGGIAHGPQVSVHGEGSLPEANVPLQDGRTIPVTISGGGGGGNTSVSISVNIDSNGKSAVESDTSGKKASEMGKLMEASVLAVIAREKRAGGLLYA